MSTVLLAWIYLIIAGISEIGWPLGFKLSSLAGTKIGNVSWIIFSAVSMAVSGIFLYLAQRYIPIGTAYIVWTGVGGVGTFLIGLAFFGDPTSMLRFFGAFLVLSGAVVLKFA